jgi:threonine synthase
VIASTASPFKFARSVMGAIDAAYEDMDDFDLIDKLSQLANVEVPKAVDEIRQAPVRHKTICEVEEMPSVVRDFLK